MPIIDCDFDDPSSTAITTGSLLFVANDTTPPVLKGTSVSITPGGNITLLAGEYKVYYTNDDNVEKYVGKILVAEDTADTTTLVSLLAGY